MAKQLNSRPMDIVITKVTAKTVKYELFIGKEKRQWRIPQGSTFDTSVLQVGARYEVISEPTNKPRWCGRTKQWINQSYEWTSVKELPMHQRSTTMTRKQSEAAKAMAALPLAGDDLFSW